VRELTAANRARVLDDGADPTQVDTRYIYSEDGIDLLEELGPVHDLALPDGTVVAGRARTTHIYDEGAPTSEDPYRLVTTTRTGAVVDGMVGDQDLRTTTYGYADGGWELRRPTSTITDPAGLGLVSSVRFDATTGLETERRQPSEPTGGGAGTTLTRYWTSGSHPVDAACGNKPEWANLPCWIGPAAQPTGSSAPPLADRRFTYTVLQDVATVVETAGVERHAG